MYTQPASDYPNTWQYWGFQNVGSAPGSNYWQTYSGNYTVANGGY